MTVVQVPRPYSVSGADGRSWHSGGEKCHNSPPRPPVSPCGGCRANAGSCVENRGKSREVAKRSEVSARRFRAAKSVQACAAAPACGWPTDVSLRATSVCFEVITRFLRESVGSTLWKAFVGMNCCFSKLWRAFVCNETNLSQRSGAPGRFRAARPTAASSRNSFPALNAADVVQVPRPYSVSRANGPWRHSGIKKGRAGGLLMNGKRKVTA